VLLPFMLKGTFYKARLFNVITRQELHAYFKYLDHVTHFYILRNQDAFLQFDPRTNNGLVSEAM
jgi:hypothetical protein